MCPRVPLSLNAMYYLCVSLCMHNHVYIYRRILLLDIVRDKVLHNERFTDLYLLNALSLHPRWVDRLEIGILDIDQVYK